ncbi:hypothetical protein F5B17DRAFT_391971 [Nemania serpens]|nr:hypothetical protein F5B17DRAFT_391971 [Nemania serpens]
MKNQWLRAIRFAAHNSRQQARLAVSGPTRSFHSTVPKRGSEDSGNTSGNNSGNGNGPRDDGRSKSEDGAGKGEPGVAEENLFGETAALTNGESQGRKKPTQGLRGRALRNRKSDLPPVEIPKPFLDLAVDRHGEVKTLLNADSWSAEGQGCDALSDVPHGSAHWRLFLVRISSLFDAVTWSDATIEDAMDMLNSEGGVSLITRLIDAHRVSAYWTVLQTIRRHHGDEAYSNVLASTPPPALPDWVSAFLKARLSTQPTIFDLRFIQLLRHHVMEDDGEIPLTKVALYEPCMVDEVITALRAEFSIRAPKNSRLAILRRPATLINVQDCSGFSVAQDTMQHVAGKLGADVLHLRAYDIAHIVGRYIGQDITRTPGDIALLGYKAAENAGRLKPPPTSEEENEDADPYEIPYTVIVRDDKARKDLKRQTTSMDEFLLNSGTRGKSDELWDDMKVNAALDELIHSADMDVAEQKPLIIHIHDFNALGMDETGAVVLGKIRKVVDELWLSGRKVVLVGSCSTNGAPAPYQKALKALEMSDRVIHLSKRDFPKNEVRVHSKSRLALWEKEDYLRENDENIVRMLWSMTESGDSLSTHSTGRLGLDKYAAAEYHVDKSERYAKYWESILPIAEVYRIATTMVGLSSTDSSKLFSLDRFKRAAAKISAVDAIRQAAAAKPNAFANSNRDAKAGFPKGTQKMNPFAEDHEAKLLSGMVNAQDMRTTFKDIHAPQETIESIKMLTTLSLIRPEAFSYGVLANDRIPGCLLYGPPGTGKTLLAKAVAKESGANMIEVSGASINNMYVGESEKNVRALFRLAKKKEPLVIFIDEADALLGARGESQGRARRETINQFLREWDGMDKTKAFIMVATNRPFDLDEAVLRRLPRKLLIDLPLEADRAAILKIHLRDEMMDETVSIEDIAKRTPLYSGSDLKNVCVAAAMSAVKEELEASERHTGPEPYVWTNKRVLNRRHFGKALTEIGASVSEDMATLTAIRKFDERYGDSKARKKRRGIGFGVIPESVDSEQARVRGRR